MSPRQGNIWLRRFAATAAGALALACAWAPVASADESALPTTQARAYNADWVPYLDPPEKPAAVCLVDSGVNITPDTPADTPEGPIVKRLALDGGPGTATGSTWEDLHGTRMAMVGGAPINNWGAVGFWPGARIISIRATPTGATDFPFDNYSRALDLCNKQAARIASVNLALDCSCVPTDAEMSRLTNEVTRAHSNDESVVAAVGNRASDVGSPASQPGVFGVAAGGQTSAICSFSNRGPGVDMLAPGCGIALADPSLGDLWPSYASGTSGASITVSVVLALVRSYRPDLSWSAAEAVLSSSGRIGLEGPLLDVESAFRAAGLGKFVDDAKQRMPLSTTSRTNDDQVRDPNHSDQPAPGMTDGSDELAPGSIETSQGRRLPAPALSSIRRSGRRLFVVVRNRPRRARLSLVVQQQRGEFRYLTLIAVTRKADSATLTLPRARLRDGRVQVRFIDSTRRGVASRPIYRQLRP